MKFKREKHAESDFGKAKLARDFFFFFPKMVLTSKGCWVFGCRLDFALRCIIFALPNALALPLTFSFYFLCIRSTTLLFSLHYFASHLHSLHRLHQSCIVCFAFLHYCVHFFWALKHYTLGFALDCITLAFTCILHYECHCHCVTDCINFALNTVSLHQGAISP